MIMEVKPHSLNEAADSCSTTRVEEDEATELHLQYEALDWMANYTPNQVRALLGAGKTPRSKSMGQTFFVSIVTGLVLSLIIGTLNGQIHQLWGPPTPETTISRTPIPSASADDFFDSPSIVIREKPLIAWILDLIIQVIQLLFKY
jgi:hypothetical protein